MKEINQLFEINPFSISKDRKTFLFKKILNKLTFHHYQNSKEYKKLLDFFGYNQKKIRNIDEIPFLPARLFKEFELKSISRKKIFKILLSSGTTGSKPSKIHLDKENAHNQVRILEKIMATVLGNKRLPMLIIDQNPKMLSRSILNARLAAIYGFSLFGKNHTYLLNEQGKINYNLLNNFLENYGNEKFFVFGFTSIVFENLIQKLSTKLKLNFKNGILVHGGGWKKMKKIKISNKLFRKKLLNKIKLENIYNYYGLVEQTGSIFIESKKCGYFVTSVFSDILIRDNNFSILKDGNKGFIQLFSLLPTSYPGHSILTEDIGEIANINNCKCGLKEKHFLVHGRAKESEVRGCSDI